MKTNHMFRYLPFILILFPGCTGLSRFALEDKGKPVLPAETNALPSEIRPAPSFRRLSQMTLVERLALLKYLALRREHMAIKYNDAAEGISPDILATYGLEKQLTVPVKPQTNAAPSLANKTP